MENLIRKTKTSTHRIQWRKYSKDFENYFKFFEIFFVHFSPFQFSVFQVNHHMELPPFNYPNPLGLFGGAKQVIIRMQEFTGFSFRTSFVDYRIIFAWLSFNLLIKCYKSINETFTALKMRWTDFTLAICPRSPFPSPSFVWL